MASLSGTLATMGPGVPYAIGAKFAHPDRPVFALVGDGAMQMNGINELITIAKYRHRWPDQRLIVLVLNNRDLNQVTWEQRAMSGDPKFEGSQDLPGLPLRAGTPRCSGSGASASSTRTRSPPAGTWRSTADRPVVLEAITDPEVPPLPPHITLEQAKALTSAILSGDPNTDGRRPAVDQAEASGVPSRAMNCDADAERGRDRRTRGRCLHGPDRRPRGRRDARPGTRRRSSWSRPTRAANGGSATATPTSPRRR